MPLSRYKLLWSLILAGMILLVAAFPAGGETELEKKMQELNEINDAIARYEKLYEQKRKEESQVLGQIRTLENNIDKLEGEITTLKNQLTVTEKQIEDVRQDIDRTTALVNQRTSYFNKRMKEIYQESEVSFLAVLMQATSLTDFLTRFDYMEKIAQNDVALLQELESARRALQGKKAVLEDKAKYYSNMKEQKEQKQQQLETQSRQKGVLLKSIQEQKEEYIRTLDELDDVRKLLDQFIKEWQEKHQDAYMGAGGLMAWPVPGYSRISSGFGYRVHPIFKVRSFHPAIDIPAPRGTPVVAAERGKVIYMGNKGGYGKAIIIDHGGGISTQYSHLLQYADKLQIGDTVNRGQVIGKVDSTGWSTGHHLDFIVRVKGEPQDPTSYVKP